MENTQTTLSVVETVETVAELDTQIADTKDIVDNIDVLTREQLLEERKQMNEELERLREVSEKNERDSFNLLLQQNELSDFEALFTETDKTKQIEILKDAVNAILVKNSYVPQDKAKQDAYDAAIAKHDVQGALTQKLSNFKWFK